MPSATFTADAYLVDTYSSSVTADAVVKASLSGSVTANAEIAYRRFTADAWILGERQRHHRVRDHFGVESDLYVALSADVGPYVTYTPVHWVLSDMIDRLARLENNNRVRASFTADALIAANGSYGKGFVLADAVRKDSGSGSITADAYIETGGYITADARFAGRITLDAYIV